jgi:hypothetical protein
MKDAAPLLLCGALMLACGGWFAFHGLWDVIWLPVLAAFLAPLLIPPLLIPAAIFGNLATLLRRHETLLVGCAAGWLVLVMAAWGAAVCELARPVLATWAGKLWAAAASGMPWLVLSRLDPENKLIFTLAALLPACVGLSLVLFSPESGFWGRFVLAGVGMAAGLIVQNMAARPPVS